MINSLSSQGGSSPGLEGFKRGHFNKPLHLKLVNSTATQKSAENDIIIVEHGPKLN